MLEAWKDIKGYEGLYQISNMGRVKSLSHKRKNGSNTYYYTNEHIKKTQVNNNRSGYCEVSLYNQGEEKRFKIHRLVADAFILNEDNKPEVNHIDGNKENNCVDNLEWVTGLENKEHAWNTELCKRKIPLSHYMFIYCINKFDKVRQKNLAKNYSVWTSAIERIVREIRETKTKQEILDYYNSEEYKEYLADYRKGINDK